jgi:flap endonuclease GEN
MLNILSLFLWFVYEGAENNIGRDDTIVEVINAYLKPKCHSADSDVVLRLII